MAGSDSEERRELVAWQGEFDPDEVDVAGFVARMVDIEEAQRLRAYGDYGW